MGSGASLMRAPDRSSRLPTIAIGSAPLGQALRQMP